MNYKLIVESWNKFINEQEVSPPTTGSPTITTDKSAPPKQTQFKTYGDLQKILFKIERDKTLKAVAGQAKDVVLDQIAGLIPGGSNIKSAFGFFKSIYDSKDTQKTNTWLDKLNVDDNYTKIIDDTIENAFLKELVAAIGRQNPQTQIPTDFNINKELENWLKQKYGNRTLAGGIKESKSKKAGDRCTRIAKRKYKVWPSAYASGAVVKCRQGKIWKGISESATDEEIDFALLVEELENIEVIEEAKKKDYKPNFSKEKEQGLHGWFARNKGKGWINCRTGGPCGRSSADKKGGKYPACRPTKAQCKSAGKGPLRKKKSSKPISWTKKKKD